MLIIPHSTQGGWENINSYFPEEVSAGERLNKLWKFVSKTSVEGSLKPQTNQVQLLHTLTPVMDSMLPLGNVSELYTEPSACMGMLTLSFLFSWGMTG